MSIIKQIPLERLIAYLAPYIDLDYKSCALLLNCLALVLFIATIKFYEKFPDHIILKWITHYKIGPFLCLAFSLGLYSLFSWLLSHYFGHKIAHIEFYETYTFILTPLISILMFLGSVITIYSRIKYALLPPGGKILMLNLMLLLLLGALCYARRMSTIVIFEEIPSCQEIKEYWTIMSYRVLVLALPIVAYLNANVLDPNHYVTDLLGKFSGIMVVVCGTVGALKDKKKYTVLRWEEIGKCNQHSTFAASQFIVDTFVDLVGCSFTTMMLFFLFLMSVGFVVSQMRAGLSRLFPNLFPPTNEQVCDLLLLFSHSFY